MVKVWKIAPGKKARLWNECRDQKCITIDSLNKSDFKQLLKKCKTREDRKRTLLEKGVGGHKFADSILYFIDDIQPGDTVVANKGKSCVVGIGVIASDYLPPNHPDNPRKNEAEHCQARRVDWRIVEPIEFGKSLFTELIPPTVLPLNLEQCDRIKREYLKKHPEWKEMLDKLFPPPKAPVGTTMKTLLEQFGQVIAYGPPGTGKTREARRVALALLSGKDPDENSKAEEIEDKLKRYRKDNRFDLVVFHPAYEYEQFVGGIEPTPTGGHHLEFETKPGVFLRMCRRAEQHENESSVLIIDEINRGNLPKLLGELVYALEYRGHEVSLPFTCDGRDKLIVPKNLYIIATMNSADRSIGHIDVAIRRRFALFPLGPSADVVRDVWGEIGDEGYGRQLAVLMEKLNATINKDKPSADSELGVGHSYFLPALASVEQGKKLSVEEAKKQVERKWEYQIKPLGAARK